MNCTVLDSYFTTLVPRINFDTVLQKCERNVGFVLIVWSNVDGTVRKVDQSGCALSPTDQLSQSSSLLD